MSLKYRDSQGAETPVAGLNGTSGELVPSVALVQSGTITIPQTAASGMGTIPVTFATPMPDTDYTLNFEITGNAWYNLTLQSDKTANGFTVVYQNVDKTASSATATVKWTAFKLMTDTVHQADAAHISQNTANFAPAFSEVTSYAVGDYCTYNNVLYRCTTAHTAGVWVAGHFTAVTVGGELETKELTNVTVAYGYGKAWRSGNTVTVAWSTENDTSVSIPPGGSTLMSGLPVPKVVDITYWQASSPYAPMHSPGGTGTVVQDVTANVSKDGYLVVYNNTGAPVSGAYRGFYITYLTD